MISFQNDLKLKYYIKYKHLIKTLNKIFYVSKIVLFTL